MSSPKNDDHLRQLLRQSWPASVSTSAQFRTAVWARIDAAKRNPATWAAWLRLHVPGVSVACVAVILVATVGGNLMARHQTDRMREALIQRYVASIDPHQQVNAMPVP
ncbi:MAG: hypothetical protein K1X42_08500 [Opitutaceae bacterium]|nr:hypothetical protein [Opitutaceae bacterium]